MAFVPVPKLEPHIEPTMGGGFRLTVPKRRALYPMLLLPVWLVAGRERVRVEQGTLTLEQVVGAVGRRCSYELRQVTGLRTLPQTSQELMVGNMTPFGFGRTGGLAFDYGTSTVRWGAGLDEQRRA